jgi:hypothetical protein
MIFSNVTYIPRQPLIPKASQTHAGSDRRQSHQEVNNINNGTSKTDNQIAFSEFLSAALNRRKKMNKRA